MSLSNISFEQQQQCGIEDPATVLFCDDSARNIAGAKQLGMRTCIVGREDAQTIEGADYAVKSLHDLPRVLPGLFGMEAEDIDVNRDESAEAPGRTGSPPAPRSILQSAAGP